MNNPTLTDEQRQTSIAKHIAGSDQHLADRIKGALEAERLNAIESRMTCAEAKDLIIKTVGLVLGRCKCETNQALLNLQEFARPTWVKEPGAISV